MWCHHVLSSETKKRTRLSNLFPAVTYVPANYIHQHSTCFKPYFIIPIGLFFLFWLVDWHFPQVVSSLCISLSLCCLFHALLDHYDYLSTSFQEKSDFLQLRFFCFLLLFLLLVETNPSTHCGRADAIRREHILLDPNDATNDKDSFIIISTTIDGTTSQTEMGRRSHCYHPFRVGMGTRCDGLFVYDHLH